MNDDVEENLLTAEMRAAFVAVELRPGFAERVTSAWLDERAAPARRRASVPLVLGAMTLAAAGTMLLFLRPPTRPPAPIRPPAAATAKTATPKTTTHAPGAVPAQPSLPDTPDALYAEAGRQLAAHQWSKARRLYGAFVGLYASDYRATRAQYQIGETFAGEKRFAEAIGAYTLVLDRAPEGDVAPDAMYATGIAFTALKHCSDAKVYFEELLARHPHSARENDAEQRLRELARAKSDKALCAD